MELQIFFTDPAKSYTLNLCYNMAVILIYRKKPHDSEDSYLTLLWSTNLEWKRIKFAESFQYLLSHF